MEDLTDITSALKPKFINAFMDCAERFAELSSAKRAQVGSIIVKGNRIISIGYNGMPSGWDNTCETEETINDVPHMREDYAKRGYVMQTRADSIVWIKQHTRPEVLHAEANAITKLAKSGESSRGAVIFCTHLPCIECAKLIHQAGISKVYYREDYNAAKGSGKMFLEQSGIQMQHVQYSDNTG
jgi:dCMP deaminase